MEGMAETPNEVAMLRLECSVCSVTATIVDTATGRQAWRDHMAIHPDPGQFRSWAWLVVPLDFD